MSEKVFWNVLFIPIASDPPTRRRSKAKRTVTLTTREVEMCRAAGVDEREYAEQIADINSKAGKR